MTPAEREALKLAAQKATAGAWTNSRLSSLNIISESAQRTVASAFTHTVGGSSDDGHNARYIAAASPEVILHLLEFISSLELTLSNATAAGMLQAERIAALEAALGEHMGLHGLECYFDTLEECPVYQNTKALLAAPTEPTPALEEENAQLRGVK